VYRVHWLRAKALRDCWQEEFTLVEHEMTWTLGSFNYKRATWLGRGQNAQDKKQEGHVCYAGKQASMFQRLYKHAESMFKKTKVLAAEAGT
ncbi:hypothetical protein C8R48DRAFT_601716, partial [Suillus tomentosus]